MQVVLSVVFIDVELCAVSVLHGVFLFVESHITQLGSSCFHRKDVL